MTTQPVQQTATPGPVFFKPLHWLYLFLLTCSAVLLTRNVIAVISVLFRNKDSFGVVGILLLIVTAVCAACAVYHIFRIYLRLYQLESKSDPAFTKWQNTFFEYVIRTLVILFITAGTAKFTEVAAFLRTFIPQWLAPAHMQALSMEWLDHLARPSTDVYAFGCSVVFLLFAIWSLGARIARQAGNNTITNRHLYIWIGTDALASVFWAATGAMCLPAASPYWGVGAFLFGFLYMIVLLFRGIVCNLQIPAIKQYSL